MRILHLCLSCFYIDDSLYQENELVREHVESGHDVRVIASTEIMSDGEITYTKPGQYIGTDGALVKRLPYRKLLPQKVMRKLRMHPGVYREIEAFAPDVIVFHGGCGWEIRTVKRYVSRHPNVRFWVDSHEDGNNSARNFLSREVLHKRYYAPLLRASLPEGEPVLCVSLETMDFLHEVYGISRDRLEFFPLGGRPLADAEYRRRRTAKRRALGLSEHEVMLFQSGKFDKSKRLKATLTAFVDTPDPNLRLYLSGVIAKDEDESIIREIVASDARIQFLGWSSPPEMVDMLAATDVYLQPGSQSVTMQNSMCQRCAIVIDDVKSHQPYLKGNGYFTQSGSDMRQILRLICDNKSSLPDMQQRSYDISMELLDYSKQAQRLLTERPEPAEAPRGRTLVTGSCRDDDALEVHTDR